MTPLGFKRGWTQFPNSLIDLYMPKLTDTEWRLLTIVVRQTVGWHETETGRRKTMDWLTQSQLKRKTGRQSAAISSALASLIDRGIVVAYDSRLRVLGSPKQRRRSRGPMYLALSPWMINHFSTDKIGKNLF